MDSIVVNCFAVQSKLINRIRWSPDGSWIASCCLDGVVRLFNLVSTDCVELPHDGPVWAAAWLHNVSFPGPHTNPYLLASATNKGDVCLWNPAKKHIHQRLTGHDGPVYSLAPTVDRKRYLASGGWDRTIRLWSHDDNGVWSCHKKLEGHNEGVNSIAWQNNRFLASASRDAQVIVWDADSMKVELVLHHDQGVNSVAWSPDGRLLASGSDDRTVRVFDYAIRTPAAQLDGHQDSVQALGFSPNGSFLASKSRDGTVRIWSTSTWEALLVLHEPCAPSPETIDDWHAGLEFRPCTGPLELASLGHQNHSVHVRRIDRRALFSKQQRSQAVTTAKVLIVGESNAGKSCLARALTGCDYRDMETTHGMAIWTMDVLKLSNNILGDCTQLRKITFWDMGGQDEYRIVNELFLQDSLVVLIVFDVRRGRSAVDQVEAWSKNLDAHAAYMPSAHVKRFLVATKCDPGSAYDVKLIDRLKQQFNFQCAFVTSAKNNIGVSELRQEIASAIDWTLLTSSDSPALYAGISRLLHEYKTMGCAVKYHHDLVRDLNSRGLIGDTASDAAEVDAVLRTLSKQGMLVRAQLQGGQQALILEVNDIERYAASLIMAARDSGTGVPIIEKRVQGSPLAAFPGIAQEDRIAPEQERIVVEGVLQLLLENGICLDHAGAWVFPSLFQTTWQMLDDEEVDPEASLYYDFSGPTDNIFSSLVVSCALSSAFGRVRLWEDVAAFTSPQLGECRIHKWEQRPGYAHLSISFSKSVPEEIKNRFQLFVQSELREMNVKFLSRPAIRCKCGFVIPEAVVVSRRSDGHEDVGCPQCDQRIKIDVALLEAKEHSKKQDIVQIRRYKQVVQDEKRRMSSEVLEVFDRFDDERLTRAYRILALSDLHFKADTNIDDLVLSVCADIRGDAFGFEDLNYLVVAGDLTCAARPSEFERAHQFVSKLINEFQLAADRCIVVPGNHDVDWECKAYKWSGRRDNDTTNLEPGTYVKQERLLGRRTPHYFKRFDNYSRYFFHPLMQIEYPRNPQEQCSPSLHHTGLHFFPLNSCWEIDEFFPNRASINVSSLTQALDRAKGKVEEQVAQGKLRSLAKKADRPDLRIAVWHHPVLRGKDSGIADDNFLHHFEYGSIPIAIHGHVHDVRAQSLRYIDKAHSINFVGIGSFSAREQSRPHAVPQMYTLMEVWQDLSKVRVHVRQKRREGGIWEAYPITSKGKIMRQYYDIIL